MKAYIYAILLSLFFSSSILAKNQDQGELNRLKDQLRSLKSLRTEKLDVLEQSEAARWEQRYRQTAKAKQHEDRIRALEGAYTRLASEMSRKQDDLLRAGNETREIKMKLEDSQVQKDAFENLLTQSVEREADRLPNDIPVGISERTLAISSMTEKAGEKNINVSALMDDFFQYRFRRYLLTLQQKLESRHSLMEDQEYPVWRLQLGTVFVAEQDKTDLSRNQILLRTGKLQGKVFVWRSQLVEDFNNRISSAIRAAGDRKTSLDLTLDIVQSKSLGSGFTRQEEISTWGTLIVWFNKGGLVMYPLILAALLGLVLSLERLIILMRKSTDPGKLMARLKPYLDKESWQQALKLCDRSKTSLSRVLCGIIHQAGKPREFAEKAMRESMLKEVPLLEKRMILIAAIGGSAPLMGLLGTVSGMISLFKVITDVGTNDPRILAGGISEALITTQTGLIIAIPILLIHGYLSDRMERIQNDITANGMEVMNKIWPAG
jgi:biopolymer transport protein ExbB